MMNKGKNLNPSNIRFVIQNGKLRMQILNKDIEIYDVDSSIIGYFFNMASINPEVREKLSNETKASFFNDLLDHLEEQSSQIVFFT
ncbi:MAG: hypothetical protein AB9882_08050 [Ignavibacteriaceae bacterium]